MRPGWQQCWQHTEDRLDARVARTAAQLFIARGDCRRAHQIIAAALDAEWIEELILLYGECLGPDVLAQIERAEQWLKSRPHERALLLTLGLLCLHQELWGKARSYLGGQPVGGTQPQRAPCAGAAVAAAHRQARGREPPLSRQRGCELAPIAVLPSQEERKAA